MDEIRRTENITFDVNKDAQLLQMIDAHYFRSRSFIAIDVSDLHAKMLEEIKDFFETYTSGSARNYTVSSWYSSRK